MSFLIKLKRIHPRERRKKKKSSATRKTLMLRTRISNGTIMPR